MHRCDVAIVGAGAAGMATAIFLARRAPRLSILLLDGTRRVGAKILVSGGGRCNVTNRQVTPDDFHGTSRPVIRRVLAAFTVEQTIAFFAGLGVHLHEEEHGKLFPDTHQARTVLDALLGEVHRQGVELRTGHRITGLERCDDGFRVCWADGQLLARAVVLATGGCSLPRTGSDGFGYELARRLGHHIIEPTPALVPLVLAGSFHQGLSGISQEVILDLRPAPARPPLADPGPSPPSPDSPGGSRPGPAPVPGPQPGPRGPAPARPTAPPAFRPVRLRGPLLWTHFGISGPVVLDTSRHWYRARAGGIPVALAANLLPGHDFASAEADLLALAAAQPRLQLHNALARRLPGRVAEAIIEAVGLPRAVPLGQLTREARRTLLHRLLAWPLPVVAGRGYNYAEVTAGGVSLHEIDPATMASRICPGLYLVGEILDVDGRIGGFNFQWAWSSAFVAAAGIAAGVQPAG